MNQHIFKDVFLCDILSIYFMFFNYIYKLFIDILSFQVFSLKIIEVDDYSLTLNDLMEYADKFKIILENKNKMNSILFKFIVTRLIDNVLLASM